MIIRRFPAPLNLRARATTDMNTLKMSGAVLPVAPDTDPVQTHNRHHKTSTKGIETRGRSLASLWSMLSIRLANASGPIHVNSETGNVDIRSADTPSQDRRRNPRVPARREEGEAPQLPAHRRNRHRATWTHAEPPDDCRPRDGRYPLSQTAPVWRIGGHKVRHKVGGSFHPPPFARGCAFCARPMARPTGSNPRPLA